MEKLSITFNLNGDKTDFRPSNLIVISSQAAHARISAIGKNKKAPKKRPRKDKGA